MVLSGKDKSKSAREKSALKRPSQPAIGKASHSETKVAWKVLLRQIPSVEEVLNRPSIRELAGRNGRRFVTERVRSVLADLRREIQDRRSQFQETAGLDERLGADLDRS